MRVLFTVFSASGNTARVCGLFAERLQERGAECVTLKIRKDAETPDVAAFDTLVIGYPVHGFNAPQNVLDFAKGLPQTDEKGYYIVKTSGEPLHVTTRPRGSCARYLRGRATITGASSIMSCRTT